MNEITKIPAVNVKGKGIILQCQNFNFIIYLGLIYHILKRYFK